MKLVKKGDFLLFDKKIVINLHKIITPFGIETYYENYQCKLLLNQEKYNTFLAIEEDIINELLKIDKQINFQSQLSNKDDSNLLTTKLFIMKQNILTRITDSDNKIIYKDEIGKYDRVDITVSLDKLWLKNNIAYGKWKVLSIKKLLL